MKFLIDFIVYSVVGGFYLIKLTTHLARAFVLYWVYMNAALVARYAGVELISSGQKLLIPIGVALVTAVVLWLPELIQMARETRRLPPLQWTEEMEREYQQSLEEAEKQSKRSFHDPLEFPVMGSPDYRMKYGYDPLDPLDPS